MKYIAIVLFLCLPCIIFLLLEWRAYCKQLVNRTVAKRRILSDIVPLNVYDSVADRKEMCVERVSLVMTGRSTIVNRMYTAGNKTLVEKRLRALHERENSCKLI